MALLIYNIVKSGTQGSEGSKKVCRLITMAQNPHTLHYCAAFFLLSATNTFIYIHPHKYVSKQMDATNHLMFTDAHFLIPLFLTITCRNTQDTRKSLPLPFRHTYTDKINQHTPNISLSASPPLLHCTLPQPT